MSKAILQPFEDYQKARFSFVQTVADLARRPQNIIALHSAGVMSLLRPLLLDSVQAIQQSSALAIGRLANYSEEIAESVVQNDIITQLIYSLSNQNRFYKKAACYVLRAVAKHSTQLADDVVKSGALDPLIQNLAEFDVGVKESAAWALGYIAKHSEDLAMQVVDAKAINPLIKCLQEPEVTIKRAASQTLCYIGQHSELLATKIVECGLETITSYLTYNDVMLKRNICLLLGNLAKHSADLANLVWIKLKDPQYLLACLLDKDIQIKKNAAFCICEVVNKGVENANNLVKEKRGLLALIHFVEHVKGEPRLYGIIALGFIAAHNEMLSEAIINGKALPHLRDALENEPSQSLKAAACYTFGQIAKSAPKHAQKVVNENVLKTMLLYFTDPNSSEDLKLKARRSLKKIIKNVYELECLEPLLAHAPENILECILDRFLKIPDNKEFKVKFIETEGFKILQKIRNEVNDNLRRMIEDINRSYPQELLNYYDPEYKNIMKDKINNYDPGS